MRRIGRLISAHYAEISDRRSLGEISEISYDGAGRVFLLNPPDQHIGVDQYFHLPAVRVEVGAADRLVGKDRRIRETFCPVQKGRRLFVAGRGRLR